MKGALNEEHFQEAVGKLLTCDQAESEAGRLRRKKNREAISLSTSRYNTFATAAGIDVGNKGDALTILEDGKIGLGQFGDPLEGTLFIWESDGYASVQDRGTVTVRGVPGNLPNLGDEVCCDGFGRVVSVPENSPRRYRNRVSTVDLATNRVTVVLE